MTAKDPGNFQKQYNSRISWDFQLQPCTKPELKSVGHSKNNTDEHCPKFACVVHSQTTITLYLCQAVDKNIFAVQRQLPLIMKGSRNTGARSAALASLATQIPKLFLKISRARF